MTIINRYFHPFLASSGSIPTASDLGQAEIAINLVDKVLFSVSGTTVIPIRGYNQENALTSIISQTGSLSYILSGSEIIVETPVNSGSEGMYTTKLASEYFNFGDPAFFANNGAVIQASAASGSGRYPAHAIAAETVASGTRGKFLLRGNIRRNNWNWTIGSSIYLATSTSTMTQTAPSATDEVDQVLGVAHPSANVIYFNPSPDYITRV